MLTTEGRTYIKRYLAGQVPAIAQCIAFGLGSRAESASDTSLQFEFGREQITLTSYDFVNNKVIFKAALDSDYSGTIYEVALYSQLENPVAGLFGSRLISTFDSDSESWVDSSGSAATFSTSTARIGGDSLSHTPVAEATTTSTWSDLFLDLSGHSSADVFSLAYNIANTNTSSIVLRFMTDSSNYYTITRTTPGIGYRIDTFTKGSAVATGSPSWENITSVQVATTATAGGAASVAFDGLRIEDVDTISTEYVMVARELLSTPYVKQEGMTQEVEFALAVNIT